jgi:hypothetical protein
MEECNSSLSPLVEIMCRPITMGSVPGGYFSPDVASNARKAGIETLFTSEPGAGFWRLHDCDVYGRYSVQRTTSARMISNLIWDRALSRQRQRMLWDLKKFAKTIGGDLYPRTRRAWLRLMQRGRIE